VGGKTIGQVNKGTPNAAIAKAGNEKTNLRSRHEI